MLIPNSLFVNNIIFKKQDFICFSFINISRNWIIVNVIYDITIYITTYSFQTAYKAFSRYFYNCICHDLLLHCNVKIPLYMHDDQENQFNFVHFSKFPIRFIVSTKWAGHINKRMLLQTDELMFCVCVYYSWWHSRISDWNQHPQVTLFFSRLRSQSHIML